MNGQDKVLDHTREQLSALFDGELALDEARFLERRLQHDAALAGCVSHWQAIGDALRGQASALAPADFSRRVAAAVAAEVVPAASVSRAGRLRRGWAPGAALAASVALVALFAARQSPVPAPAGDAPSVQVAQAAGSDASATLPVRTPEPPAPQVPAPEAVQLAAAVAVAEVPRRAAASRRASASRGQAQRAAATRAARDGASIAAQPQYAVAAATPASALAAPALQEAVASDNPFAPSAAASRQAVPRPWPRALLPNAGGAFNVGYGSLQGSTQSGDAFHPFRPRVVAGARPMQDTPDADAPAP